MKERIASLDYMRAFACLMVILTHSNEPFYMGADGMVDIASQHNLLWISILDGFSRMATVPIFFLISSYLLLPLQIPTEKFFRRRFERVVVKGSPTITPLSRSTTDEQIWLPPTSTPTA